MSYFVPHGMIPAQAHRMAVQPETVQQSFSHGQIVYRPMQPYAGAIQHYVPVIYGDHVEYRPIKPASSVSVQQYTTSTQQQQLHHNTWQAQKATASPADATISVGKISKNQETSHAIDDAGRAGASVLSIIRQTTIAETEDANGTTDIADDGAHQDMEIISHDNSMDQHGSDAGGAVSAQSGETLESLQQTNLLSDETAADIVTALKAANISFNMEEWVDEENESTLDTDVTEEEPAAVGSDTEHQPPPTPQTIRRFAVTVRAGNQKSALARPITAFPTMGFTGLRSREKSRSVLYMDEEEDEDATPPLQQQAKPVRQYFSMTGAKGSYRDWLVDQNCSDTERRFVKQWHKWMCRNKPQNLPPNPYYINGTTLDLYNLYKTSLQFGGIHKIDTHDAWKACMQSMRNFRPHDVLRKDRVQKYAASVLLDYAKAHAGDVQEGQPWIGSDVLLNDGSPLDIQPAVPLKRRGKRNFGKRARGDDMDSLFEIDQRSFQEDVYTDSQAQSPENRDLDLQAPRKLIRQSQPEPAPVVEEYQEKESILEYWSSEDVVCFFQKFTSDTQVLDNLKRFCISGPELFSMIRKFKAETIAESFYLPLQEWLKITQYIQDCDAGLVG